MCGYKCNNDLHFLYRLARGSRTAIKVAMLRSGDHAADNSCNTDSDNSSSASPSSEKKSGDFSISAILSDDTGGSSSRRKRGPTARERRSSSGAVVSPPAAVDRTPHHMQQTGVSSFECLHNSFTTIESLLMEHVVAFYTSWRRNKWPTFLECIWRFV